MKWGRLFFLILLLGAAIPVSAKVIINEVAWMGTEESASNEWIELYSDHGSTGSPEEGWNLAGWTLVTADGGTKINLKSSSSTDNYYLIERTDDNSVSGIKADLITPFGKGLSNAGEILILKDASGVEIDRVDGSNEWALGGDSVSKRTLQRAKNESSRWITAAATPKAENADYVQTKTKTAAPSSTPGVESPKTPGVFPGAAVTADFTASTLNANPSTLLSGEYLWLLGGILGGALLGVIILIWLKNR